MVVFVCLTSLSFAMELSVTVVVLTVCTRVAASILVRFTLGSFDPWVCRSATGYLYRSRGLGCVTVVVSYPFR